MGTSREERERAAGSLDWLKDVANRMPGGAIAASGIENAERVVDRVPVLAWLRSRAADVEQSALQSLRDRLVQLEGVSPISLTANEPATARANATPASDREKSPAEAFAALLEAAESQSATEAREAAMLRIIGELVPDEARILRTLADGSEHAVLQAHEGGEHLVKNRSNVGRNAKVHAQELTSRYVTHLLDLGLVELAPYEGSDLFEYELIEAETEVRETLGHYDHRKLMKPKITRQVIRISEAGRRFCEACLPA